MLQSDSCGCLCVYVAVAFVLVLESRWPRLPAPCATPAGA